MGCFEYTVLQVKDGNNTDSPLLYKYCGTAGPSRVQSTQNYLYIKFRASSLSSLGFRAEYWPLDAGKHFLVLFSLQSVETFHIFLYIGNIL